MDRIQKMRARLVKHRTKIASLEAQAAEMENDIKKAEEEQLGYLARSAANMLSGGMDEVFELLRNLRMKPDAGGFSENGSTASGSNSGAVDEVDNPSDNQENLENGHGSKIETEVVGLELADETNGTEM